MEDSVIRMKKQCNEMIDYALTLEEEIRQLDLEISRMQIEREQRKFVQEKSQVIPMGENETCSQEITSDLVPKTNFNLQEEEIDSTVDMEEENAISILKTIEESEVNSATTQEKEICVEKMPILDKDKEEYLLKTQVELLQEGKKDIVIVYEKPNGLHILGNTILYLLMVLITGGGLIGLILYGISGR